MLHLVRQGRANTSILQVKCDCRVHRLESGAGKRIQPKIVRNVSQKVVDQSEHLFYHERQKCFETLKDRSKDKPHLMPFDSSANLYYRRGKGEKEKKE